MPMSPSSSDGKSVEPSSSSRSMSMEQAVPSLALDDDGDELCMRSRSNSSVSTCSVASTATAAMSTTSSAAAAAAAASAYSWAFVSLPPHSPLCELHAPDAGIGYVFQKKDAKRRTSNANASSMPGMTVFPSASTSSRATPPPQQQQSHQQSHQHHQQQQQHQMQGNAIFDQEILQELDDDLCNLIDSMLHDKPPPISTSSSSSSYATMPSATTSSALLSHQPTSSTLPSTSLSQINGNNTNDKPMPPVAYGQCRKQAQWHPHAPPPGVVGESVVITTTPLPRWQQHHPPQHQPQSQEHQLQQHHTISTTRIVTCYCGPNCTCPGCLVHPTNSLFASQGLDPYAGYPAQPSLSSDED
ncbi:hypothetical protein BC940DRAFT_144067 [Gongronella butleri]|nr:hypothetical protein BC940DRAFT_144067 [Gongronella butleri]